MSESGASRVRFRLRRDHLYVDSAAYAAHMPGLCPVALLRRGDDLHVAPLIGPGGGGYLVKQINARGDRAIHAADFFRLHGVDDVCETTFEGEWSEAMGELRFETSVLYSVRLFFAAVVNSPNDARILERSGRLEERSRCHLARNPR
jgi:hypothetical protein